MWLSIFGHVQRLPEATPAHSALRLAVDARTGSKPDIRPEWKRQRGRPCRTWVQQIEDDTGLNANDAWRIAHDRKSWRALRPVAGQAFHWLTYIVDNLLTNSQNDHRCQRAGMWYVMRYIDGFWISAMSVADVCSNSVEVRRENTVRVALSLESMRLTAGTRHLFLVI